MLKQKIEAYGIKHLLHLPSYIRDEDLPTVYGLASVVVFPSVYEGFGLPVLVGMACGAPVITFNVSSLPEVTGDAAVLVDHASPEQLSDAMRAVLTSASLRASLAERGRRRAQLFNWGATAHATLRVYERAYTQCHM